MRSQIVHGVKQYWGVLVVAIVAVLVARVRPIGFDGGLNLQIQQSLASGHGYVRFYDAPRVFASEVETNGAPIFLGAIFIAVLGQRNIAFQMANVVFLVALAVLLVRFIGGKRRNWLMLGVLASVPQLFHLSLNGLGEFPMLVFELGAIWLLSSAVAQGFTPRRFALAGLCAGLAFTTKVVALALVVPVGFILMLGLRGRMIGRRAVSAWVAGAATPVVGWEAFRLYGLGSPSAWLHWWNDHARSVLFQAGGNNRAAQKPLLDGLWNRFSVLASSFRTGQWTVTLLCVAVLVGVGLAVRRSRSVVPRERWILHVGVYLFVLAYFLWWFFLTPDEKAWLRRLVVAVVLLLALVAALYADREARPDGPGPSRKTECTLALLTLVLVIGVIVQNGKEVVNRSSLQLRRSVAAADWVRQLPADDHVFGIGWWQAPVISAYSRRGFLDLAGVDRCTLSPVHDVFMIDEYARMFAFAGMSDDQIGEKIGAAIVERRDFGGGIAAWRIGPPSRCTT